MRARAIKIAEPSRSNSSWGVAEIRNLISLGAGVFSIRKQSSKGAMCGVTIGSKGNSSLAQAGSSYTGFKIDRIRGLNPLWQKTFFFCSVLLLKLIYFYRSIINLQCCVNFRCTAKWFSYTYIYIYFFQILFPYRLLQNIEYSSVCYTIGPCWLSILFIAVCTCQSQAPNLSLLPPTPP